MEKITKAVITAGGTGTRLLPFTKEIPKEMMPIYDKSTKGDLVLKPILEIIYESIFNFGINEFCFVVGRGKRSVENHFLSSDNFNYKLKSNSLQKFYNMIDKSNLVFVQQSTPKGFGDAVNQSKFFVGNDCFLMHAGDDIILSKNNDHLRRLENAFIKNNADMAFLVNEIEDPRSYGVVEGIEKNGVIHIENMEEKPKKPKTNLAVIATYIFRPSIFTILNKTKPDKKGEIQLADAAKIIIKQGKTVAVKLKKNEKRIDVGTPQSYIESLNYSYKFNKKK